MTFGLFELAAIILTVTAAACWLNAKTFRLPVAVGLLVVGLAFSAVVWLADAVAPQLGAGEFYRLLHGQIDYPKLVLDFLLCYLLFAGADRKSVV